MAGERVAPVPAAGGQPAAGARRLECGRLSGRCGFRRGRVSNDVARGGSRQAPSANRPGAAALGGQHPLGDGDLLVAGGLVGRRGVLAATVGGPGALRELQPAVVPVAGVDAPVTARLAGGDAIPFAVGSRGCVTGEGDATAADYCAGEGQFGDADG